jgi:beta-galactosidase
MKCRISGEKLVKRANGCTEIFHREDPTRPVTVGMDQVKATMESGFGAVGYSWIELSLFIYEAFSKFPQGFIWVQKQLQRSALEDL